MRLETFFEKFNQFADAPDAVAKMRKLILQLAVQGRLKSQDDEAGFPQVRLDSLGSWAQGCGFPVAEQGHADRPILFSKVSDMNLPGNEREILKTNHTIDEAASKRLRIKVHPSGTVIFPKIGGAIATNKRRVIVRPTAIDNNCSGIIPNKLCSTHWLFLVLSAIDFAEYQSGTSVPAVNQGALGEIEVSLPPLAEQKQIVAKVDELMALCDRLEAQQQERETWFAALARASLARFADAPTPANLDFIFHKSYDITPADLRKSILTLAVHGKLVPQDPNDEPAEEILRRCKVDLKRWAVAPDEERQAVPDSWTWIRFAGVGEQRLGKMLDAQKNRGEWRPYLRNTNVQWMRFELDDVKDMRVEEREVEELRLKTGDLLICEGGEPGRCAIWRDEVGEMYFQKAIHRVRPCDAVTSEYLSLNLQIDCSNGVLARFFTGATIKHLTGRSLAAYPVPIPPLAEQRRIVAKVDQLMALVDALETQLAASRATAANLLSALVAELTSTPNDGKVAVPSRAGTGRRGRPKKS